jgi:ABC-type glycerol-3-phosphate transport system substrate-binding protein
MDLSEVPLAADAGILQPLEEWLLSDLSTDWFPFASRAAQYENHWRAVPFAADLEHLVYNKSAVRKPPQTWDEFTKQKSTLLLPLAGMDAFAIQYLGLTAPIDTFDVHALDANIGAQVLIFFKRARELGLIPTAALSLKNVDEVWPWFAAGQVPMAQVSASRYLTERTKLATAAFAAVPTREGKLATVARGWAFAVITRDARRQQAAAQFMQWLLQRDRLAAWLRAAHLLPVSRALVPLAVDPPDYAAFVRDGLEHAVSLPATSTYSRQSEAWLAAISAVWNGQTTPEEAARSAAASK